MTEGMGEPLRGLARLLANEPGAARVLLDNPEDNPICSISIDRDVPCAVIVWKRYATSTQLRFIHEWLLEVLTRNRLSKLLGDDTALPTIHSHDQRWIAEDWMPRATAAGLKAAASRRPESHFARLAVDALQSVKAPGLQFGSFSDVAAARRWLASQ